MARSRNIKPQFYLNEHLAQKSPYARLLFIGLWCLADCKGRLEDRPMRIKAALFPYESVDIDALLDELATEPENFIVRYQVDGNAYIEVTNFHKHQNPHKNEKEIGSRIPPFSEKIPRSTVQVPDLYQSGTELAPELHSTTPADSLLLIPDSLTLKSDASASECVSVSGLEKVSKDNQRLAQKGMTYLASLNSPNHLNIGWITGYLSIQLQELEQARPDIPKPEILAIWRDVSDLAVSKNATAPQWFKTTFKNKLDAWTPNTAKTPALVSASGEPLAEKTQALLEFPFIRHIVTEQVFSVEELEIRPDAPNGLTDNRGNYYPVAHLEGMTEVPSDA